MITGCENVEMIAQGAEGKVFSVTFLSREAIVKERIPKKYRVQELDEKLRIQRLRQEARCMVKCRRFGVLTPRYLNNVLDQINIRYKI
jgi:TP53 regulating kinase-like protein